MKKKKKRINLVLAAIPLLAVVALVANPWGRSEAQLPPDGLPLYRFLLKEAPELVSQVPCACCGKMLKACYLGACPPD